MEVIVIGGGIAGVHSAVELICLHKSVLVLEARNRIGGRLATFKGLELGANWIHGTEGNPTIDLINKHALEVTLVQDIPDSLWRNPDPSLQPYVLLSDIADSTIPIETVQSAFKKHLQVMDNLKERVWKAEMEGGDENKLPEDAKKCYLEAINELKDIDELEVRILHWFLFLIEGWMGCDLDQMDSFSCFAGFESWGDCPGSHWTIKEGYTSLVQRLIEKFGVQVQLNTKVTQITNSEDLVEVTDSNGNAYKAKKVLVTVPLNVLKSGDVMFTPELPNGKVNAMKNVQMCHYKKVYLEFSSPFWEKTVGDAKYFGILPSSSTDSSDWGLFWIWHIKKHDSHYILGVSVIGRRGAEFEAKSLSECVDQAMSALRSHFSGVPEPIDSIISNWDNDEFAKGAYAFNPLDSTEEDIDQISASIADKVFFAGDACDAEHLGSVSAAIRSSQRAVEQIVKTLQ
jgi:monoamine oxidase